MNLLFVRIRSVGYVLFVMPYTTIARVRAGVSIVWKSRIFAFTHNLILGLLLSYCAVIRHLISWKNWLRILGVDCDVHAQIIELEGSGLQLFLSGFSSEIKHFYKSIIYDQ
mmetsp:Transcript_100582/g.203818  ORF Transcript_100582/g.203818 Transcript_100582/m.203818 type:complete len:111 (+) Transcript_100582:42-374(+)